MCLAERTDLESMFKDDKSTVLDLYLVTGVKVSFWSNLILINYVNDNISTDCWDKEPERSLYM